MKNEFNKSELVTIAKCISLEVLAITEQSPKKLVGIANSILDDLKQEAPAVKENRFDEIVNNL